MILKPPFIIGPRLAPALQIAGAFLTLETWQRAGDRVRAVFVLDIGDQEYTIDDLQSGCGGFRSRVEPFESLLAFMEACAESIKYAERTGLEGENVDLFAAPIAQWCADNIAEIECARMDISDENGTPNHSLIEG
jgi:hypothetical protein